MAPLCRLGIATKLHPLTPVPSYKYCLLPVSMCVCVCVFGGGVEGVLLVLCCSEGQCSASHHNG